MGSKSQIETSGARLQAARSNRFWSEVAPAVSRSCVCLLSAIACECDVDLCYFDVDQAFVQSRLDENVLKQKP